MFKKIDHKNEALKKFFFQFQDKNKIQILNSIIARQLNDIEDTLASLNDERGIDNAVGKQLDVIGIYKNVFRYGVDDVTFRQLIKNQIALDSADGSCESAINSTKLILNNNNFSYSESTPARCEIFAIGFTCSFYQYSLLKKSISLGVALDIRFCDTNPFGFAGNSMNHGFNCGSYASVIGDNEWKK